MNTFDKPKREKFELWCKTWQGKKVLEKHKLSDYGIWKIKSEDNSYGGPFDRPIISDLGIYEGTLRDVIYYATSRKEFYTWGTGGEISFYKMPKIKKVDDATAFERQELVKELAEAKELVAKLEKKLEEEF